jgi:hypothetical protein
MLQESAREEQIAAARRIPKEVTIIVPEQTAYVPAPKTETPAQTSANNAQTTTTQTVAQNSSTPAKTESAVLTSNQTAANTSNVSATDSTMPQPRPVETTSFAPQTGATDNKLDVATAIRNVVTPTTNVSTTAANSKTDANVAVPMDDLAPKPPVIDATAKADSMSVIELGLTPEKTEMTAGERRQLALQVNSSAPLGMAVVMLRFDPKVLKVTNITPGNLFADPKSVTITQMKNDGGVLLVSVTPAAGTRISGEGALLNFEFEAVGNGDSSVAFDLSNVHFVTSDGSASTLQISSPVTLTVKPAPPAAKPSEQTGAPAAQPATPTSN